MSLARSIGQLLLVAWFALGVPAHLVVSHAACEDACEKWASSTDDHGQLPTALHDAACSDHDCHACSHEHTPGNAVVSGSTSNRALHMALVAVLPEYLALPAPHQGSESTPPQTHAPPVAPDLRLAALRAPPLV